MSRFLNVLTFAALLSATAAKSIDLKIRKPLTRTNVDLMQLTEEDFTVVTIEEGFLSPACFDRFLVLQRDQEELVEAVNRANAVVFAVCFADDRVSEEELLNATGPNFRINAQPCSEVVDDLSIAESRCSALDGQICDMTISQLFDFELGPGNSYEVQTAYDLYYCLPNSCSANEFELMGAIIGSQLAEIDVGDSTGESVFGVNAVCFDDDNAPRDFNAGSAFRLDLEIDGEGLVANGVPAAAITFTSTDLRFNDAFTIVTDDVPGEDWGKAACATLNRLPEFAQACYCDVPERGIDAGDNYIMSLFCSEEFDFLCRAVLDAEDGQIGNEPLQTCMNFNGDRVGISLSGEPAVEIPIETMETNPTIPDVIQPTFPNGQTLPPNLAIGNGPVVLPPLVEVANGASSTTPSVVAAGLVTILAVFSQVC